jgi:hypothetical protein
VADTLTIISIGIAQIRDGAESFDTGIIPKIVDLNITLHNDSSTTTLHVSKLLGAYDYEEALQRLNIDFREPDPLITYRTSPFTPPLQDVLAPGETKIFQFTLPLTVRVVSGFGATSPGVKQIDASKVKEVTATFAYGTAPLRPPSSGFQAQVLTASLTGVVP